MAVAVHRPQEDECGRLERFFVKIQFLGCGRAIGPKLRARHCIFAAGIHRGRGPKSAGPRDCVLVSDFAGWSADCRRISLRYDRVACSWHVREFVSMAGHRFAASSDGDQASFLGFLPASIKSRGLRPARRIPLPLLPVQCQHLRCCGLRKRDSSRRRLHLVRRAGLGRCRISDRRSGALRDVAGHASQVLRSCLACACCERKNPKGESSCQTAAVPTTRR